MEIEGTDWITLPDWFDRFEPPLNRGKRIQGPLPFVKLHVGGHRVGPDYRWLLDVAGEDAPAVYGVWAKLLELAADEPADRRDGLIRNWRGDPATAADVARETMFPIETVRKALKTLSAPEIGWIRLSAPVSRCTPENGRPNDNENGNEHLRNTETKTNPPQISPLDHNPPPSVHAARTYLQAVLLHRISPKTDDAQRKRDATTWGRLTTHVLTGPDYLTKAKQLETLVHEITTSKSPRRRAAVLVAAARRRWGTWKTEDA